MRRQYHSQLLALHTNLIQQTDLAYPIILSASGRVMDGMHRACKAFLENRSTVDAVQFTQDPYKYLVRSVVCLAWRLLSARPPCSKVPVDT